MNRRTFARRAVILLGGLVALPAATIGAAPLAPERIGPCEPDGTSVANVPGFNRLEYALDQYARTRGYTVELTKAENTHGLAGYVDALPSPSGMPRNLHACFYVPLSLPPFDVVPTIWQRTIDTMGQLDRVPMWANE